MADVQIRSHSFQRLETSDVHACESACLRQDDCNLFSFWLHHRICVLKHAPHNVSRNQYALGEVVSGFCANASQPTDPSPRLLQFESHVKWCEHGQLGLTHQMMNLQCGLQIAAATGRRLLLPPLLVASIHTGCSNGLSSAKWLSVVDVRNQPVALEQSRQPTAHKPSQGASSRGLAEASLDHPADVLNKSHGGAKLVTLRLGRYGAVCNPYMFCTQRNGLLLPRSAELEFSAPVTRAADRITKLLGGFRRFRGLHLRQGDKVQRQSARGAATREALIAPEGLNPGRGGRGNGGTLANKLNVPVLSSFDLVVRLLAIHSPLPAGDETHRVIYVAHNAREALVRSPCMSACYDVRTQANFTSILIEELGSTFKCGYQVLAVEMTLPSPYLNLP